MKSDKASTVTPLLPSASGRWIGTLRPGLVGELFDFDSKTSCALQRLQKSAVPPFCPGELGMRILVVYHIAHLCMCIYIIYLSMNERMHACINK